MVGIYEIYGVQYQNDDDGQFAWHITAIHTKTGEIHDYWVVGGDFLQMAIHFVFNHTASNLIQPFGPVTKIDSNEKQTILDATTTIPSQVFRKLP
jgi:hypothetical protein